MSWENVLKTSFKETREFLRSKGIKDYLLFPDINGTGESNATQWAQRKANETGKNYLIFEDYDTTKDRYFFTAYQKLQGEPVAASDQIDIKPQ